MPTNPPAAPTLLRDDRGWWVETDLPDGVLRRIGPMARKGEATMLLLRLAGVLALGEPDAAKLPAQNTCQV